MNLLYNDSEDPSKNYTLHNDLHRDKSRQLGRGRGRGRGGGCCDDDVSGW